MRFVLLAALAISLAGCVGGNPLDMSGGGGSGYNGGKTQAESKEDSDKELPGETEGGEVKDDAGNGLGFGSNSG